MSDFVIGGLIIAGCLFVFVLMAYLVIESHKKRQADKKFTVTFTELDREKIIAGSQHLRQWSKVLRDQDNKKKAEKNPDPTLEDPKDQFESLLVKQQTAIDNEDYELAAECRDELQSLQFPLKKFDDEDQAT